MSTTTQERHLSTAQLAGLAKREQDSARVTDGARNPERPLFLEDVASDFRSKWDRIQTGFVDEPRQAVQQADELVAQAIKCLAEKFAEERNKLEQEWDRGDEVNTEDLRVALQTYRSFFHRLLSL
jgi:hypothetical protein